MRYEEVEIGFWNDKDFAGMTIYACHLYLWSWTNSHGHGLTGTYSEPLSVVIAAEAHMTPHRLEGAFKELEGAGKLFRIEGWLWVVGRAKRNIGKSPNHDRGIMARLKEMPQALRVAFCEHYPEVEKIGGFCADWKGLPSTLEGACKPSNARARIRNRKPKPKPKPKPTPKPDRTEPGKVTKDPVNAPAAQADKACTATAVADGGPSASPERPVGPVSGSVTDGKAGKQSWLERANELLPAAWASGERSRVLAALGHVGPQLALGYIYDVIVRPKKKFAVPILVLLDRIESKRFPPTEKALRWSARTLSDWGCA